MKMTRGLLFFLSLFLFVSATAQEPVQIELPDDDLSAFVNQGFFIDSIYDTRANQEHIGWVMIDPKKGHSAAVNLKGGFLLALQTYLHEFRGPARQPTDVPLILEIRQFLFRDNMLAGASMYTGASLTVDFVFHRRIGQELQPFHSVRTTQHSRSTSPIKSFQNTTNYVVARCFKELNQEVNRRQYQAQQLETPSEKLLLPLRSDSIWRLATRTFVIDTVIDARPDPTHIGLVQKGLKKERYADLASGFLPTLREYLFNLMPNYDNRYERLTMEVSQFLISNVGDVGRFELDATFYRKDSLRQLIPVFAASVVEESSPMGLTASHPMRIKEGLLRALTKLNEYRLAPEGKEPIYKEFDRATTRFLKEASDTKISYPAELTLEDDIRTCQKVRTGMFVKAEEFRLNRPSVSPAYGMAQYTADTNIVWLNDLAGKRIRANLWGFSNGRDLYVYTGRYNYRNRYCRVLVRGRYLAWVDGASKAQANNGVMVPAAVAGGMIGSLMASALLSSGDDTDCLLMDPVNGVILKATKRRLWELCENDPDLRLKITERGTLTSAERLDLIREWNRRHP